MELFRCLIRSYFRLIFQPLFLPDLIKWDQTFQEPQLTLNCLADIQSVALLSLYYSLPSTEILSVPQVKIDWGTSMTHDRLSNQSCTFIYHFCVGGDNLLGGIFLEGKISEFMRSTQAHRRRRWILNTPISRGVFERSEGRTPDLNKARQG